MSERKINYATYAALHDQAFQLYTSQNYFDGYTYPEHIATWITHDIYVGVLDHLELKEFNGMLHLGRISIETRKEAEIEDMVIHHWAGEFAFPPFFLRHTIKRTLDALRLQGKLKDE